GNFGSLRTPQFPGDAGSVARQELLEDHLRKRRVAGSRPVGAAEALRAQSVPQATLSAQSRPLRSSAELSSIITTVYERIERDRRRNCWIHVRPIEEALAEAEALVQRAAEGEDLPLLGVPFGVKDNIDVEGMPTTAACPSFEYVAARSAECVERLTAAGAI
ncbi:hypothetical protein KXV85_003540, partial [Aspergillus fumigatus]